MTPLRISDLPAPYRYPEWLSKILSGTKEKDGVTYAILSHPFPKSEDKRKELLKELKELQNKNVGKFGIDLGDIGIKDLKIFARDIMPSIKDTFSIRMYLDPSLDKIKLIDVTKLEEEFSSNNKVIKVELTDFQKFNAQLNALGTEDSGKQENEMWVRLLAHIRGCAERNRISYIRGDRLEIEQAPLVNYEVALGENVKVNPFKTIVIKLNSDSISSPVGLEKILTQSIGKTDDIPPTDPHQVLLGVPLYNKDYGDSLGNWLITDCTIESGVDLFEKSKEGEHFPVDPNKIPNPLSRENVKLARKTLEQELRVWQHYRLLSVFTAPKVNPEKNSRDNHLSHLTNLSLDGIDLRDPKDRKALLKILYSIPLKTLSLVNCQLDDEACAEIIEAIMDRAVEAKKESLEHLDLSGNQLKEADKSGLSIFLRASGILKQVTLLRNQFSLTEEQKLDSAREANKSSHRVHLELPLIDKQKRQKKAEEQAKKEEADRKRKEEAERRKKKEEADKEEKAKQSVIQPGQDKPSPGPDVSAQVNENLETLVGRVRDLEAKLKSPASPDAVSGSDVSAEINTQLRSLAERIKQLEEKSNVGGSVSSDGASTSDMARDIDDRRFESLLLRIEALESQLTAISEVGAAIVDIEDDALVEQVETTTIEVMSQTAAFRQDLKTLGKGLKESPTVVLAIEEHWMPKGEKAPLPSSEIGTLLSIAEKLDNLLGCFTMGLKPSSSSDPYALRRQVMGLIRMLLHTKTHLPLKTTLTACLAHFPPAVIRPETVDEILDFIANRIKTIFHDEGMDKDLIEASLSKGVDDIYDMYCRVQALQRFKETSHFPKLLEVYKRAKGQLQNQHQASFNKGLLSEPAEYALAETLEKFYSPLQQALTHKDYDAAYHTISTLQAPLARLFDEVKILAEEPATRQNRLALLAQVFTQFEALLDFSKVSS